VGLGIWGNDFEMEQVMKSLSSLIGNSYDQYDNK